MFREEDVQAAADAIDKPRQPREWAEADARSMLAAVVPQIVARALREAADAIVPPDPNNDRHIAFPIKPVKPQPGVAWTGFVRPYK